MKKVKWLWPGIRREQPCTKMNLERVSGEGKAVETPIGLMPAADAIDVSGLDVPETDMKELLSVNKEEWLQEVESIRKHYSGYGKRLPKELALQLDALEARLKK